MLQYIAKGLTSAALPEAFEERMKVHYISLFVQNNFNEKHHLEFLRAR